MKKQISRIIFAFLLAFALNIGFVFAVASFSVTSFSCTPSEVVINNVFSCTAQIKNIGDQNGSVDIATLYPDESNWLESTNYPQASGTNVNPLSSVEITFTGLRAVKSGNNGFSKIMLDTVTDIAVTTTNVNVINVIASVSNTVSSAAMNAGFTSSSEITAGGNIDVVLTLTINSGGCSIGSQSSQKTISGMQDGNKQTRTWTVTQGTSGDCEYTISAAATGTGGVATKTDFTSSTVTCSDCSSGTTSSSGGGGGSSSGGGGAGAKTYVLGEITASSQSVEFSQNERIKFNFLSKEHTITLTNLSDTKAIITIESKKQTFTLNVGDEINVDINEDKAAEINIKLKSINVITKKANLILTKISEEGVAPSVSDEQKAEEKAAAEAEEEGVATFTINKTLLVLVLIFSILAVGSLVYYLIKKKKRKA